MTWELRLVSSRKLHAWTWRGEDGSASETRLSFRGVEGEDEDEGEDEKGAVKENVEDDGGLKVDDAVAAALLDIFYINLWVCCGALSVS